MGYDDTLSDKSRQLANDLYKAASQAASLTRQLLVFSRQNIVAAIEVNLNEVVTEAVSMLDRVLGGRFRIVKHLQARLWLVRADAGQLNQVVMNVALNARDAMADGGAITITTANVDLDATTVLPHLNLKAGPHVVLSISDTGHGMDQETISHIFEPFFTTKESGRGTGLGLSTVFGIVRQSGGDIAVHSEVGTGTTFEIYLPKSNTVVESSDDARVRAILPRGIETVMVVEDDDQVSELVGRLLQSQGYTVIQTRSVEDALMLHKDHQGPIHLLLTDVVMPNLDGRQLFDRLHAEQPDLKVLFMSGYPQDTVIRHGIIEGESHFIEKPFSYQSLANAVRKALDSPG